MMFSNVLVGHQFAKVRNWNQWMVYCRWVDGRAGRRLVLAATNRRIQKFRIGHFVNSCRRFDFWSVSTFREYVSCRANLDGRCWFSALAVVACGRISLMVCLDRTW